MKEQWKPIDEFYDVSDLGRVRSWKNGKWGKRKEPRLIKPTINSGGYYNASIHVNKKMFTKTVHRLMIAAFYGPSDLDVNHKNGIKTDNRLENLEYCTHQENMAHAAENSLLKPVCGEKHGRSKITDEQALEIFNAKGTQIVIAENYKVTREAVSAIKRQKIWKHIHKELNNEQTRRS